MLHPIHRSLATLAFVSFTCFSYATPAFSLSTHPNDAAIKPSLQSRSERPTKADSSIKSRRSNAAPNVSGYADGGNADGDRIAPNTFQVPGTNTTVVMTLGEIGDSSEQRAVLNGTYNFILAQILASGDGQLPQAVDPFYYDLNQGAYFTCQSVKGQHLTWGILGAAAGWFLHHLGEEAHYRYGVTFSVHDAPWGLVGGGEIKPGYTNKGIPQVIGGPDGVAHYS